MMNNSILVLRKGTATSAAPFIDVDKFGAKGDGVTNDAAAIQAAHDAVAALGGYGIVTFSAGATYKCNTGLNWIAGRVGLRGNGVKFDFTALTSGFAMTVDGNPASPFNQYQPIMPLEDFAIVLTKSEANNADGIRFGRYNYGGGNAAHMAVNNLKVYGGRDAIVFGNQVWCITFLNPTCHDQWRSSVSSETVTNAGENINFHGGALANCKHSTNVNACNIRMVTGPSDLNFFGTSFDYSDYVAIVAQGNLNLVGCHLENNSDKPMIAIDPAVAKVPTVFLNGGGIYPTEVTARASLVEINTSTYTATRFRSTGAHIALYGKTTEFVKLTNEANIPNMLDVSGTLFDTQAGGTTMPTIGNAFSQIFNGDFETNSGAAPTGWTVGTLGTYTANATAGVGRTGNALQVVNAGSGNLDVRQGVPCRPGQEVFFSVWINVPTISAGSAWCRLRFQDAAGTNLIQNKDHYNTAVTTGGWVRVSGRYPAPKGTQRVELNFYHLGLNGTVRWDDAQLWVV